MNAVWTDAIKRSLKRPAFVAVLVVLLLGAVGLNAATTAMQLYFRKLPLPLRAKEGLTALPLQIGSWVCVPEPHTINPDLVHDLQTDQYVFRTYVDTAAVDSASSLRGSSASTIVTRDEVIALEHLGDKERWVKLNEIRSKNPNAVMSVAVTYYTGKVDTVPHVPDRCYVADGFVPSADEGGVWQLGQYPGGAPRQVPVRSIDFSDQTDRGQQNRCVSYFFHANGEYKGSPLEVRQKLQSLTEKYGYFAKIEVMTLLPFRHGATDRDPLRVQDRQQALGAMQKFLTAALPDVENLLPDWNARPQMSPTTACHPRGARRSVR